jgi:hypothetical protein
MTRLQDECEHGMFKHCSVVEYCPYISIHAAIFILRQHMIEVRYCTAKKGRTVHFYSRFDINSRIKGCVIQSLPLIRRYFSPLI